jgi:hypothetical protein
MQGQAQAAICVCVGSPAATPGMTNFPGLGKRLGHHTNRSPPGWVIAAASHHITAAGGLNAVQSLPTKT